MGSGDREMSLLFSEKTEMYNNDRNSQTCFLPRQKKHFQFLNGNIGKIQ